MDSNEYSTYSTVNPLQTGGGGYVPSSASSPATYVDFLIDFWFWSCLVSLLRTRFITRPPSSCASYVLFETALILGLGRQSSLQPWFAAPPPQSKKPRQAEREEKQVLAAIIELRTQVR